jgi:hypothetical protein
VKRLRLCLLVLLALLLPVRGTMAAALLCPPGGTDMQVEMPADHHAHHGTAADAATPASPDKCTVCAAYCSAAPLLGSPLPMPPSHEPAAASFPRLIAPVPSFVSGGPERPPRSI